MTSRRAVSSAVPGCPGQLYVAWAAGRIQRRAEQDPKREAEHGRYRAWYVERNGRTSIMVAPIAGSTARAVGEAGCVWDSGVPCVGISWSPDNLLATKGTIEPLPNLRSRFREREGVDRPPRLLAPHHPGRPTARAANRRGIYAASVHRAQAVAADQLPGHLARTARPCQRRAVHAPVEAPQSASRGGQSLARARGDHGEVARSARPILLEPCCGQR